jgi:uncharacterized protein
MTKSRLIALLVLFSMPVMVLSAIGSYHLYSTGWAFAAWWPMALCWIVAYVLAWRWTRSRSSLLPRIGIESPPPTWTDRDTAAWAIVEARIASTRAPSAEQLADAKYYSDEAIGLAQSIAKHYVPDACDPFTHLTIPEILTCVELVAKDLSTTVRRYLPGSHLLTIRQWQQARQAAEWGQQTWNLTWIGRVLIDPIQAGTQFLAAKAGGSVLTQVQENVLAWFHETYLREVGRHLIELNSGRLRVGRERYEALQVENAAITISVVGAVKAGKSSLINAILGMAAAEVATTPQTDAATEHHWTMADGTTVRLIDTPGYGIDGPTDHDWATALATAITSDIVVLALHAKAAARRAEAKWLERFKAHFASHTELKMPDVIVAMTHVDLLTPAAEWAPPYNFAHGTRVKEITAQSAMMAIRDDLGAIAIIPVCTAAGRIDGIADRLIPAIATRLPGAKGVAFLKAIHATNSFTAAKQTVEQVLNLGKQSLKVIWDAAKSGPKV